MDQVQSLLEKLEERESIARLSWQRARPPARAGSQLRTAVAVALAPVLKQAGPSVELLRSRWAEIVGERLAKATEPSEVISGKGGATLVIRAPSAAAGMIQHAHDHIIQRVNLAVGSPVTKLRIDQTTARPRPASASPQPPRRLSAAERAEVAEALATMPDNPVRAALARLGEAIVARYPSSPPERR
ncbi:DUF721 domain-containing protein [bacterium]|nr:DUF721 domain-containing protein [bacterium]